MAFAGCLRLPKLLGLTAKKSCSGASALLLCCRAKMMGFNAVRIEWSVDGLTTAPKDFQTDSCSIASTADIRSSMLPPTAADTPHPSGSPTLPQDPPTISNKVCSADLPNTNTTDRYVYLVHYLCGQVMPFFTYQSAQVLGNCSCHAFFLFVPQPFCHTLILLGCDMTTRAALLSTCPVWSAGPR